MFGPRKIWQPWHQVIIPDKLMTNFSTLGFGGVLFGRFRAGLPDGLFSNQKSQFGKILEGLRMEKVCLFYDHLEYFAAIWYNIWPFCIVCCHLV
jgi:hypothetical protein